MGPAVLANQYRELAVSANMVQLRNQYVVVTTNSEREV
jgi:hypothetical protein